MDFYGISQKTEALTMNAASVSANDYGAICDGNSHPLSTLYDSLVAAQSDFPSAVALSDELDSVAIQKMFDAAVDGSKLRVIGSPVSNKTLYLSNKNRVEVQFEGGYLLVRAGPQYSLIVHGATVDRTLSGSPWSNQFLSQAYETASSCVGVKVTGLKVRSFDGVRRPTQLMFYFADKCEVNADVQNSNGNGVEFRHCAWPKYSRISIADFYAYGLFVYQCHGMRGGDLIVSNGGRALEIKQRHKLFASLSHVYDSIEMVDLAGVDDPAWITGGQSYNEQVRAGASLDIVENRNFPGHEISTDVIIRRIDGVVSAAAAGNVVAPSVQVGCFADGWRISAINLDAGAKSPATVPIIVGARGDISAGLSGGATFGQNHELSDVFLRAYQAVDDTPLLMYGVACSVRRLRVRNCTVSKIVAQLTPASSLPFGSISQFEFRDYDIDVKLKLGPVATRGIIIPPETLNFLSGSAQGKLRATPVNYGSETICNPWYVQAPTWNVIGRDEVEVAIGGAEASNHTTTYGIVSTAVAGRLKFKAAVAGPITVTGVYLASATSSKALTLESCEIGIVGSTSGAKTALATAGEVNMCGSHTYLPIPGSWNTTLSDTSGKNVGQNARRVLYGATIPTTGAFATDDIFFVTGAASGTPWMYRRATTGSSNVVGTDWKVALSAP
ncbi:hypothetical protein [Cupriavidus sp. USMAA2-4]|uniref:hypothetical protein n=1 Tax=Cupriavidus sp. USMAA2-4 TaxID=876364 RepID=UPI0012F4E527|nr:hypothetical protein [Cupriavidus sp. USMAA2-4]